jgi:hypothetical protein
MTTLSTNYLFQKYETKNYLLKKDDIGKGKESCFDLPETDFAFGYTPKPDKENAKQCKNKNKK